MSKNTTYYFFIHNFITKFFYSFLKTNHSSERARVGGGKRIRTVDPPLAKRMLYQLSYTPYYAKAS